METILIGQEHTLYKTTLLQKTYSGNQVIELGRSRGIWVNCAFTFSISDRDCGHNIVVQFRLVKPTCPKTTMDKAYSLTRSDYWVVIRVHCQRFFSKSLCLLFRQSLRAVTAKNPTQILQPVTTHGCICTVVWSTVSRQMTFFVFPFFPSPSN